MLWVIAAIIVGVVLVWALAAPPADSVAVRESAIGALRSAVERAAAYSPPPADGAGADDAHHNVHVIGNTSGPTHGGHEGMAPAA